MYSYKHEPDDFQVEEISNIELSSKGPYTIYLLEKEGLSTEEAIAKVSQKIHIQRKNIGYAGLKDKQAHTKQYISVRSGKKQDVILNQCSLTFVGFSKERIALGMLEGNAFTIKVTSDVDINKLNVRITALDRIPNYFGEQRFSKSNHLIGKCLVHKDFMGAAKLLAQQNHIVETSNPIQAIRTIPKGIVSLFINAYQSLIFNRLLLEIREGLSSDQKLPLIGYGTELHGELWNEPLLRIMEEENLTFRNFIISQIPELSSYGAERSAFLKVEEFSMKHIGKHFVLKFILPPGGYATTVLSFLFETI